MREDEMAAWVKVGEVMVDSGRVWIGDPCYTLPPDGIKAIKTWEEFIEKLEAKGWPSACEVLGAGFGVCVASGRGDGRYPVEAKFVGGRVREVRIRF